jgi:copper resistance protein B
MKIDGIAKGARALCFACAFLAPLPAVIAAPAVAAEGDDQIFTFFQIEQLEYRFFDGKNAQAWDAQGWIGEDYNKLWLKTEGEKPEGGDIESAEIQVLYSRLISDFFDAQVGLRQDFAPDPERTYAVLGIQGLAPQFFEVDAAAFVSHEGEVSGRVEAEFDLLLTQRLVLQPTVELNFALQDVKERGIGSGLSDVELGLRLRYEIIREFAPYIGIHWERKVGETADFAREEGEDTGVFSVVAGVRVWF